MIPQIPAGLGPPKPPIEQLWIPVHISGGEEHWCGHTDEIEPGLFRQCREPTTNGVHFHDDEGCNRLLGCQPHVYDM